MPRPRPRDPAGEMTGGPAKSPMARATEGRPFKPYVWQGERDEPPAVAAARQRHRDVDAEIAQRMQALDDEIRQQRRRRALADATRDMGLDDPGEVGAWFWLRELTEDAKHGDDGGAA